MRRRLVLALLVSATAGAQQPPSAKVIERYKQILVANPGEGTALDRLWQAYSEQGRSGELIAEFAQQPTSQARLILGLLLRKAGKPEEAAAAFEKAAEMDASNPTPALALARMQSANGESAAAVKWLERALALIPDSDPRKSGVLMELGTAALAAGDLTKATDAWERTVTLTPNDLSLRRQLADTYARSQLGANAIPHLEFVVKRGSAQERTQAWQQIGAIHVSRGDQDAAIHAIEQALAGTSAGNWMRTDLVSQLIRLHERYHRTLELETRWKKYAEENPRDLGACLQLIELYERTGQQVEQAAWLEKLVVLVPKNVDHRLRLARLQVQLDQLDRAAILYDEILSADSRNAELIFERARIDVQRDQLREAGDRISALLVKSGRDEGIRLRALEFFQANRLFDLAEKHLQEDATSGSEDAVVSLATFYFSRHRDADARATLERLVRKTDSPEKQAAGWFRIADQYKAQNDLPGAAQAVRSAIELNGEVREYHFMLGELESAAGHDAGAEVAFEKAFELSKTPAEIVEADQRLYDCLRNQKQPGEDDGRTSALRPDSAAAATSAAAQTYLLKLIRRAVEKPSEAAYLRVARWQQWSRNQRGSIDYAERALQVNPKSIPAHDFLARLYSLDSQTGGAREHLEQLAQIDPANRSGYLRRLGQVQLQAGDTQDALATYQQIVKENPGDIDTLNDLAIAQQRGEQWNDALVTLRQVHSLSPASRKRDAVNALLRVLDRLGLQKQAAELLLQQIDSEAELRDRFSLFADLLTLCTRQNLLDWLRVQYEQRHRVRVDDYFAEVALGRVLKAQGNKTAAFEVLADAALSASDPGEALPELIREAEELHRLGAAVQLQERFVRVVPQPGPDGWLRLAELQERNLQPDAAAQTWDRLIKKFPRDVQVLEKAAAFERTWGQPERALTWLRRVRAIDPTNHRVLAHLAELNLSDGDPAEAEACLEQILAQAEPEKATDPIRYPAVRPDDPSRLEISYRSTVRRRSGLPSSETLKALRTFWFDKGEPAKTAAGANGSRLEVIRDLAEIVAGKGDSAAVARWVARWQAPECGTSERLWALYFVGASGPLLDAVEKLMSERPGEPGPVNAFIWLALQTGDFDRFGAWSSDRSRTPGEHDFVMVALEQYLDEHHGPLPSGWTEKIFTEGQRSNLWQSAAELAQRGYLDAASVLGGRVLDRVTTQRAPYALELAQWRLQAGDLDGARHILRTSLTGAGETLNSALYGAIRALYLLLPESERPVFAEECLASVDPQSRPIQSLLTRALLAGLSGQQGKARAALDELLSLRALASVGDERSTSSSRHWEFVLAVGAQLVTWQLDGLAVYCWEKALSDEASIALQVQQATPQGETVRSRVLELRTRLTALKIMRADPYEMDELLAKYARYASPDGLLPLAEALELFGANAPAIVIYERLWAADPADPHALRNALTACRNATDWVTLERILERVVSEGHFLKNDAVHRDLVQQLVDVHARRGDFAPAKALLRQLIDRPPHDARPMLKLAELDQRSGEPLQAEATYQRLLGLEPGNASARLSLAALLEAQGRTTAAVDLLERASGAEIDARLATLNLKLGRTEEALAALERVIEADRPRVTLAMANDWVKGGEVTRAMNLLRLTLGRTSDSKMGFMLQSRLIELMPPATAKVPLRQELRRLRQLAEGEGGGLANYYELLRRESVRLGWEAETQDELAKNWDAGRGEVTAGVALLAWRLSHGDAAGAEAVWGQLRGHPLLDAPALQVAVPLLDDRVPVALRIEIVGRLARLDPGDAGKLVTWAKALHRAGRGDEAARVAEEVLARTIFAPDLLPAAAEMFVVLGREDEALRTYRRAIEMDPTGQKSALHLSYLKLLLSRKEWAAARGELRTLSRNPSANPVPGILEYLRAADRLAAFEGETSDFALTALQSGDLRLAVFEQWLADGSLPEALALAERFPVLLESGAKALGAAARKAGQYQIVAAAWETALAQGVSGVGPELAGLLAAWAEVDLASLQVDAAIEHLSRAHALQAQVWSVAERLARLRIERKEPALAAQTLREFLAASSDAGEKEKATQMLARIPGA